MGREVAAMQEKGMSDQEIRMKTLAANATRAREKANKLKAVEPKPEASDQMNTAEKSERPDTLVGSEVIRPIKKVAPDTKEETMIVEQATALPEKQPQDKPAIQEQVTAEVRPAPVEPAESENVDAQSPARNELPSLPRYVEAMMAGLQQEQQVHQEIPAVPSMRPVATGMSRHAVLNVPREAIAPPLEKAKQVTAEESEHAEYVVPVKVDNILQEGLAVLDVEPTVASPKPFDFTPVITEELPGIKPAEINPLTAEGEPDYEQVESTRWANELEKEPLQIYEDFTEALQALVLPPEQLAPESSVSLTNGHEDESANNDGAKESQPLPVIVVKIAERLAELETEEKKVVAPVLANIVEVIHTAELNETHAAESAAVAELHLELSIRVAELCERLGIEYEKEDVEQFVAVILRPDFKPPKKPEALPAADLEHDGTREAKIHLRSTAAGLIADVEQRLQRLLGSLVLLRATA